MKGANPGNVHPQLFHKEGLQDPGWLDPLLLLGGIEAQGGEAAAKVAEEGITKVGAFTYARGAAKHFFETTGKGELERPFMRSPLMIQEIMAGSEPMIEEGSGAFYWVAPGSFRGSDGFWNLIMNDENVIYHFNFTRLKP